MAVSTPTTSSIRTSQRIDASSNSRRRIGVRALVIAGGGGASAGISWYTGAGGAGGFIDQTLYLQPGTYTCTVGAGGATLINNNAGQTGNSGNNSVFATLTANAGGRGGTDGNPGGAGVSGGSAGGSGNNQSTATASDLTGQGASGGRGYTDRSGGGGGAFEAGNARDISYYKVGGHGRASDIISTTVATSEAVGQVATYTPIGVSQVWFSGGGAGASNNSGPQGLGGLGGGGNGGGAWTPVAGTANTGGGGGGAGPYQGGPGGGSGVIILRIDASVVVNFSAGLVVSTDTSVAGSVAYIVKSGTGTVTIL